MIDDGVLVRYLDGELSASEREGVEQHTGSCADCTERIEALRRRSEALGRLLREVDAAWLASPPAARRGRRRPLLSRRLLAAAATLLVVAAVTVVSPLRAWIVERSRALWEFVVGSSASEGEDAAGDRAQASPFASVSFAPATRTLVIEVAERQDAGTVTVESVETPMVSATIAGGAGPGDLVVLPGRLRIANAASSTASYRVSVPPGIERVEVWVAGAVVVTLRPSQPGERWETPLAAAAGRRQNSP